MPYHSMNEVYNMNNFVGFLTAMHRQQHCILHHIMISIILSQRTRDRFSDYLTALKGYLTEEWMFHQG